METTRTVRFVGGPLHGESRTVHGAKAEYRVAFSAATALATAMGEEEMAAPPEQADLVYARRRDGRYYLRAEVPAGFEDVPEGFTFDWFEGADGMYLLEVSGPPSDVGHATTDLWLSIEFLSDPAGIEKGPAFLLEEARDALDNHQRKAILNLSPDSVQSLADALEAGTPASLEQGNRRVAAGILRLWAEHGLERALERAISL